MERVIKFRGKRHGIEGWLYFDLLHHISDDTGIPPDFLQYPLIPETVGQFTGLTDKNGKEIYEGDILRKPKTNDWTKENYVAYEVFFHDNDFCESSVGFQMNRYHFQGSVCGTSEYYKFIPKNTKMFEIIGNLHDNAELLK